MARPGTVVSLANTPNPISIPTDTGVAFMAGLTDLGPLVATPIFSLADFVTTFGARQSYSSLYDAVELFFAEGGNEAFISRVVGPGATSGTHNLLDGGAGISLVATAIGPGAWSANYKVAVAAGVGGGTYKIQVTDAANNVLEDSGDLTTQLDAVTWSQFSKYIRITLGATALVPAVAAAAALSAGTDDRASVTDAQWLTALNAFSVDLGPGQVLAPGRTTTAGQQQLVTHAESHGRVALIDLTDSPTAATLEAAQAALTDSRFAACWVPWTNIPGLTNGSPPRTVPSSALIAGLVARNDPSLGPNRPAAGTSGESRYAVGISQPAWDDATRTAMNALGVNVIINKRGTVMPFGWRSFANPTTDSDWLDFGNARLFMSLSAEFNQIGDNYLFDLIDGQHGQTIGAFHDALAGACLRHYNAGELFGDTSNQAFSVDVGPSVNTLATLQALELHAVVSVKMSPFAEYVAISIVKRQITQSL